MLAANPVVNEEVVYTKASYGVSNSSRFAGDSPGFSTENPVSQEPPGSWENWQSGHPSLRSCTGIPYT